MPGFLVAVAGVGYFWREADRAVREAAQDEAIALAEIISTTFTLTDHLEGAPRPASAHRAVHAAVRADASKFRYLKELRVLDRAGVVRWSRRVEEEGKRWPDADRLLKIGPEAHFTPAAGGAEVVRPLGGIACAGCHVGETTMKVGVLQLTLDEPSLRQEMTGVFQDAFGAVLAFALAIGMATWLSLRLVLTRPLKRLTDVMQRAEEGDFLARVDVSSNDEIGRLAHAFNRMLAKITSMKADEIDTAREMEAAQEQLRLKKALEETNRTLTTRVRELTTLYDVARSLNSTLALSELLSRITALVPERLEIPQFSIMLLNADGKLEVKSAHPRGLGTEGVTFAVGEGACGRAAQSMRAVYIPDLQADTAIYVTRAGGGPKGRGSLLSVPMVHGGALLGVINFERPERDGFMQEEIEFLSAVADQAAMAVKNAQLHEKTVELSLTDPLTGVPNRRHLMSRLEMEIARANRFGTQLSLLMIDIDHFKKLNDSAGHRAGDSVLRAVCELMRQMVRRVDTLARYGGEEFVVALPQVTKNEAVEVAEKLRRAVEEAPIEHREVQPTGRVTISVGVANLPVDAIDLERLVDCADSALYASKRGGRNRVTGYAPGMELHPGRERGPHAQKRTRSGEQPAAATGTEKS